MRELHLNYYEDCDDGEVCYQCLESTDPELPVDFEVSNLNECPEDAIIRRDLFDVDNFVNALNLGIQISKAGYDAVALDFCGPRW